jgi:CheY-like chemotaxis protein
MPGVDGWEAARRLKGNSQTQDIPRMVKKLKRAKDVGQGAAVIFGPHLSAGYRAPRGNA